MIKVDRNKFAGESHLSDGVLADIVRGLAQHSAKVVAGQLADLTDNSGGAAADGTVGLVPACAATPLAGDTCPTKAEVETAFGTAKDALTEIGAQIAAVAAKVPAFTPTNSLGGAAADRTIGAVTVAFTGAITGRVAKAGFNDFVDAVNNRIAELARDVNKLAVATGQTEMNVSALPTLTTYDNEYAALATDTGVAAADGTTSVTDAEGEAAMVAIAAAVKELATKLNAITDSNVPAAEVVAI